MKLLLVGEGDPFAEASALFGKPDLEVGRAQTLEEAILLADPLDAGLVLVHLALTGPALRQISELAGMRARILVLADADQAELRTRALAAGATDVLFKPVTAEAVENAMLAALGRPQRANARFTPIELKWTLRAPGAQKISGTRLMNLSRGGLKVMVKEPFPPGTLLLADLEPPPPLKLPTLYARVLASETTRVGGGTAIWVRARFVGMTEEERVLLDGYLKSLEREETQVDVAIALPAVEGMTLESIAPEGALVAGVRVPPLTPLERGWLAAAPGTPESGFAEIALARCRASMMAYVLERAPRTQEPPHLAPWQDEIRQAQNKLRDVLTKTMAIGDQNGIRDLRELLSRLNAATSYLEGVAATLTGTDARESMAGLQEAPSQATFDKAADAPAAKAPERAASSTTSGGPRRSVARPIFLTLVMLVLIGAVVYVQMQTEALKHQDRSRTVVATNAEMTVGRVRIRKVFQDMENPNVHIAIVDGSWFEAGEPERKEAALKIADEKRGTGTIQIRDYLGRSLATVGSDGVIALVPVE